MKELKNWKNKLQTLSLSQLFPLNGGCRSLNYLNSSVFFLIFVFNTADIVIGDKGLVRFSFYSLPFLLLSIFSLILKSNKLDIGLNVLLSLLLISTVIDGDLSGLPFLLLSLYQINKRTRYIPLGVLVFISLGVSSVKNGLTPLQASIVIILYGYVIAKYYFIIHKPSESLKQTILDHLTTISDLKRKLSILGTPKGLTDDQILEAYEFMRHTEDKPYRKIEDLRLLALGVEYKEIAGINSILNIQTVSSQFKKMRISVGKKVEREIPNNTALIFACVELNILKLNCEYVENI